jgi:hypothetical protein
MANVCELTRRGYRDVSLNKIISKPKRRRYYRFRVRPWSASRSIHALRCEASSPVCFNSVMLELHFRESVETSLVSVRKVGQVSIPADSAAAMESRPTERPPGDEVAGLQSSRPINRAREPRLRGGNSVAGALYAPAGLDLDSSQPAAAKSVR